MTDCLGGTQLKTTGVKAEEVKAAAPVTAAKDVPAETVDGRASILGFH